jgi:7,8-dihydropterin-6-yl-methyl-4-(beta-D-ribofuranosyl)aminobenzene 5'-phosphate synthase
MKIKILFDATSLDKRFHTGWGVSFLINDKILFDTGEKGPWLVDNMNNLGVDATGIKAVVISHDHWDHQGGLWAILERNPKLNVYACPGFGKRFKSKVESYGNRLIEVYRFTKICENIYTTGEIEGRYAFKYMPEQALVLKTPNGLTILTGCAHPGIIKMIEDIKRNIAGKIFLILGGFHLMDKDKKTAQSIVDKFKRFRVKKAAPTHCTGKKAIDIFREKYRDDFIKVQVGETIEV